MTLPTSGQLSINDINALFQRGTKLSDYRGTHWYKDDCSSGYFNSTNLKISDFYGTRPDAPTFSVNVSGYDVNLYWYCVARGSFRVHGEGYDITSKAGDVLDWEPHQLHEFISLEPNSRIVNIIKS